MIKMKLEFEELISQEHTLLERIEDSQEKLEKLYNLAPGKPVVKRQDY
jgi:hypothetical protein